MEWYLFTSTLLTLIVILDPPGLLPIFLGLTRQMSRRERIAAARNSSLVALGVIAGFAVFGRQVLDYLHVSIPALQVAGGLLLLLVALDLLQGKEEDAEVAGATGVAIVPLGIPLLAGPGSIVAIMIAVNGGPATPMRFLTIGLALVAAMAVVYLCLRFAGQLKRLLREGGITLASRVAGMLLAGIAVQMTSDGVFGLIRNAQLG